MSADLRPTAAPRCRLETLATVAGAPCPRGASNVLVTGVTHDSRVVRPGDLYAALPGAHAHGAEFAAQAAAAGAVALLTDPVGEARSVGTGLPVVVVDDPRDRLGEVAAAVYGRPAAELLLIGVTGTNGKTTTSYLLDAGLRAAGHRTGLLGTVETRVGEQVLPSIRTTPEAPQLHALLRIMREREVTAAAMEVSSHALVYGRVGGTRFDVAVFTNLSRDHLDFHLDMEGYFAAKALLFTSRYTRRAVVNLDDPYGRRLLDRVEVPVTTYSAAGDPAADWRASRVEPGPDGSTFRLAGPGVATDARVGIPGGFNVDNALAAVAALVTAGVPFEAAVEGVGALPGVPGRMERVEAGQPFRAVVDFAHEPGAVEAALTALRDITAGRLVAVLGCGGDRDRAKRPLMGAAVARLADVALLTSDNPRSEHPLAILESMASGVDDVPERERGEVVVEPDRARAIARAVAGAGPGDTVVVLGKGHEQGQDVGGVVRPFDDRVVLADAIRTRGSEETDG